LSAFEDDSKVKEIGPGLGKWKRIEAGSGVLTNYRRDLLLQMAELCDLAREVFLARWRTLDFYVANSPLKQKEG